MGAVSNHSVVATRRLAILHDQGQTFLVPLTLDDDRSDLLSVLTSFDLGLRGW